MRQSNNKSENLNLIESLTTKNFLFQDLDRALLAKYLTPEQLNCRKTILQPSYIYGIW